VNFLNKYPTLSFTLGFIELQVYKFEKSKIVIPNVISRTKIIERTIVEVKGTDIKSVNVDIVETDKTNERSSLSNVKYYENLRNELGQEMVDFIKYSFEDMEELGCKIEWKKSNIMIKYPVKSNINQKFTLYGLSEDNYIFVGWIHEQLKKHGLNEDIGYQHYKNIANIFDNIDVNIQNDGLTRGIHIKEMQNNYKKFLEIIQLTINKIEQAL
ncbi:MAG: hypothetical protein ACOC1K_02495, partial [Nanoarchaeota archaeon]